MCCDKESYEQRTLTRRQVLRAMGVGTGLMVLSGLTGCTQLLSLNRANGGVSTAELNEGSAFSRFRKAKEKLDQHLLREYSQTLKQLVKQARQEIANGSTKIERLRKLGEDALQVNVHIIDHSSAVGVWAAADQDWIDLLSQDLQALTLPTPDMVYGIAKIAQELGLSTEERNFWIESLKWDNAKLLEAIQQEGLEQLWRNYVTNLAKKLLAASETPVQSPAIVTAQQESVCPLWCHFFILLVELTLHSECGNCNEPTPPPECTKGESYSCTI